MISPEEERRVLSGAYVPEHLVGLMRLISKGEPFLSDGHLCFAGDDWVIVVGYPLEGTFSGERLSAVVGDAVSRFDPDFLWFIAPEVPGSLAKLCEERESDHYYTLTLEGFEVKRSLGRLVARASRDLTIERDRKILKAHQDLIGEFLERGSPSPPVRQLFLSMADYVPRSATAIVLTARDRRGEVSAFYVVELEAMSFATYVVGCHSRRHYVPGASDLLLVEMVNLARERGRSYIHLGLGVNDGIRAFKAKWGGVPSLRYEFRGRRRRGPHIPPSLASRL